MNLALNWTINASYTYVDTERRTNDRIWTNLPEHTAKLSTRGRKAVGCVLRRVAGLRELGCRMPLFFSIAVPGAAFAA